MTGKTDNAELLELAGAMDAAAYMYGLISRMYLEEPSADFIAELRQMRFPAKTGNEYVDEGYRLIAVYLSRVGAAAQDDLAADYCRTFIGNGTDSYAAAYPIESVHTGRKRLIMQASRDEVLAIYRAYGLEKSGHLKDGEDHIAYELEFMQFLANRCADILREGDGEQAESLVRAQLNFLDDHLLNWVGKLTKQMRHFARTDFYQGVSYLTFGFCKESRAALQEMLG